MPNPMHVPGRRPPDRGFVNVVTLVLIVVIGSVAYLGYAYLPHWMRNRDVISAMREAGYQAWREGSNDALQRMILSRTDRIVRVAEDGEDWPAIEGSDVSVERDRSFVYIDVSYEVPMRYPWTSKVRTLRFDNHVKTDLEVPTK
ncbi:hypothetical protein [Vulgatibacter incomptus]|nr:hypothetical protein [Vulgatibacter incomptus]